jgi:tRNA (uracil-5-)-methyltransferase TRM9
LEAMELPYEKISKHFDETRKAIWQSVGMFLDKIPPNSFVADVACGNGKYVRYRNDIFILANDICKSFTEIVGSGQTYDTILADGLSLPYRRDLFDYAISVAVVHHVRTFDKRIQFIQNIIDSLKPGGKLLFTVWAVEQKIKSKWVEVKPGSRDYSIPWLDKYTGETHHRFYHLFSREEINSFCTKLQTIDHTKTSISFEKDNWITIIHKTE